MYGELGESSGADYEDCWIFGSVATLADAARRLDHFAHSLRKNLSHHH